MEYLENSVRYNFGPQKTSMKSHMDILKKLDCLTFSNSGGSRSLTEISEKDGFRPGNNTQSIEL